MIMYIIDNGKCAQESQNTTVLYQQWQMHLKNNGILIAMTTLQLQLQHENKQWPQNRVLLHFLYMILRASIVLDMVFSTSNAASQWQHPHDTVHLQYLWESELVLCSSLLPMACIVAWEVGMKAKDTRNIASGTCPAIKKLAHGISDQMRRKETLMQSISYFWTTSQQWERTNHGLFYFESSARLLQSHTRNLQYRYILIYCQLNILTVIVNIIKHISQHYMIWFNMIQLYYYIQLILFGIQRNHTVCWSFNEVCCCEASCSAFQAFQPWLVSGAMSCSWSQYIAWPSWPSYWRNSSKLGNANIDIDHISYIHMIYHIYIYIYTVYIYMIYHLSIYIYFIYIDHIGKHQAFSNLLSSGKWIPRFCRVFTKLLWT